MKPPRQNPKNLMLVDDYGVVIEGLRALLDDKSKYNVSVVAYSGEEAVLKVNSDVDLVIMDIHLPDMDGIETTARIKKNFPKVKVLVMSRHTDPQIIKSAIEAGTNGYVTKEFHESPLENAIDSVLAGNTYFCKNAQKAIANLALNDKHSKNSLSKRELEILRLLVQEHSNEHIAKELFISVRTVETHRKNIMSKIGAHNLAGIVKYAYKHGIAMPPLA